MDKPSSPTSHRVEEPIVEEEVPGPLSPPKPLSSRAKPEDLVARAIAPVIAEYLRPLPSRSCPNSEEKRNEGNGVSEKSEKKVFVKDKKSKRQLKRERQQERKSAQHICPVVAKTGNQNACQYGSNCRFSHDVDAFLAQKPADLEGTCPFLTVEESCPYGIGCRYFSTHKELVAASEISIVPKNSIEVNALKKDLQKLLWKNKFSFSKADTQLRLLGLLGGDNSKAEDKQVDAHSAIMQGLDTLRENNDTEMVGNLIDKVPCNPSLCTEKDCLDDASTIEDLGPPKKAKNSADENGCPTDTNSGTCHVEIEYEEPCALKEFHDTPTDISHASKVELCPEINAREKKLIDFRGKLYLAPLTTVGNLPFRRVCKGLGADITCGEMAMCTNLLQGQASEWALLRRHSSEDVFGVQICGAYPDTIARAVELIGHECNVDFIDINMGCPIDIVVNKGAGSSLLTKPMRMKNIIKSACGTVNKPITVKVRTGYFEGRNRIDSLIADISQWGATALTIHGRSRQQRYSKLADWDYIYQCAQKAPERLQVLGNGDISSYLDWNKHTCECPQLSSCMIARGALIKPWIFTEIKEQRHWDITSGERFQILEDFARFGLQHWGSDHKGVETTRHFLLEWLSYTYRYIPVGLLDVIPQRLNWRPPSYFGRNDLETLMASDSAADWIRISEMLLGNVPDGFSFAPKHKSNAYDTAENG